MVTPEEAYGIKLASDPFVHEGSVYFTLNWIEKDEYRSSIYRYDGSKMERVTFGGHEKSPKITEKGLYYISYDKEEDKLLRAGNMMEPEEIYSNKSISKFIFHENSILMVVQDSYDKEAPIATNRIKYRYDTRGFLRTKPKLVQFAGEAKDLVAGDFDIVDVASDGKRIIFSATIEDDDRGMEDVYELNLKDLSYRRITEGSGYAGSICLGMNGEVAYTGHRKGNAPWASSLLVFPETGKEVRIGNTADNSVGSDHFVSGGQSLLWDSGKYYLLGQEGGSAYIYSFDGNVEKLTRDRISVESFHASNGRLAYIYTSPEKPSVLSFDGNELDLNPDVMGVMPERVENDGKEAWLMMAGRENPTVVSVHGGPQGSYGYTYSIEFNYLVSNGFNVLYGNPRGSDGYGEEFAKGCIGDWGGEDLKDILGFVDAATEKYGLENRFAITGGSYGGYMTNAAITKTEKFACAVSERCVSNLMSMCGTSDIGFWFNAVEAGVEDPWSEEGMAKLLHFSPVTMAKNVKTPTMFIHGEEDYRCPIEQSEQMYTALKMNGIDTMLVRYPGDSHEHARRGVPKNMRDRLTRKLEWFRKYMVQ